MGPTNPASVTAETNLERQLRAIATEWAAQRSERQGRRYLDRADFDRLFKAGFLRTGVPVDQGGLWDGSQRSVRRYADLIYTIARGDPSVALVASMHPVVLATWMDSFAAPEPYAQAWAEQREWCFQTALNGSWWGTVTSEPGSGGDIMKTRAVAETDGLGGFRLSGDKHFGSGSGVTDYMITTAKPAGQTTPTMFFLRMGNTVWDGSSGVTLTAEWDGHGMSATQSCGSAWKRDPGSGVIGVEKGPLIPVV